MADSSGSIVKGNINSEKIYDTHVRIKAIADAYAEINIKVDDITKNVRDNWVGQGRNEFDVQYKCLISKVKDFGDSLLEIYESLVDSEQAYEDMDDSLGRNFRMAMDD